MRTTRQRIAVAWLIGHGLQAQPVEVSRYDLEQGLPQSMANHLVQDAEGFIWLGTDDGHARFDGSASLPRTINARGRHATHRPAPWPLARHQRPADVPY